METTIRKYPETPTRKLEKRANSEVQAYNSLFTEAEFKAALKRQKNTAPGEDTLHPQIIKMSPP